MDALMAMPATTIAAASHIPALSGSHFRAKEHGRLVRIDGAIATGSLEIPGQPAISITTAMSVYAPATMHQPMPP
jgi:hypothetical protein